MVHHDNLHPFDELCDYIKLRKWEQNRIRALENNLNILIEVSNIQIYQSNSSVEVNFTQRFKSSSFSDIGIKELIWKKIDGNWKILKETWMPI